MAYHPEKSSLGVTEVPCFFEMLPFDIVHDIFVLSDDPASDTKLHGTPIVISHVCKRWREYALIIPALWNALRFHPAGLSNGWQDQLVFLERSQEAPLDIEIRITSPPRSSLEVSRDPPPHQANASIGRSPSSHKSSWSGKADC
ncbi:hypothetical protein FRC03_000714 [Tulasnella sp. 419]|nr:hypothetical protein FRC03_000714 [Tulasnella sp. 419]